MTQNDIKIDGLLQKIADQKKKLGPKPKSTLITNGVLQTHTKTYNINVSGIQQLVEAYADLLKIKQEHSYMQDAMDILNVKSVGYDIGGYSITDWMEDIKNKVAAVQWNERKRELDKTEEKLNQMVSEDVKTSKALSDIENLLQ